MGYGLVKGLTAEERMAADVKLHKFEACSNYDEEWCILYGDYCDNIDEDEIDPHADEALRCMRFDSKGGYVGFIYSTECSSCGKNFGTAKLLRRKKLLHDFDILSRTFICDNCVKG